MACYFNDSKLTSGIVHAAILHDDVTAYWRSYRSKTEHRRLLAAINRWVEYIMGQGFQLGKHPWNNTFVCEQTLCGWSMTSLLILSCPFGAHQAILLVLFVQRTPYLNGCTNQRTFVIWGMNVSERILRHPCLQGRMSCQAKVILISYLGWITRTQHAHSGGKKYLF